MSTNNRVEVQLLADITSLQRGMQQATQAVRNFHQAVSQPINIPTPNMSGWNSAVQSAGQQVQQLNSQLRNTTPPPPPNMNSWQSTFQNVGNGVQNMGRRVQSVGQSMTTAFAPAAAASGFAFGKMIQDARAFEEQTRRAAVLTGGSYNQVKTDILDMAKTSVYSTSQVASAFAEMGAKGFDASQATAALPGVLSAAAASGEDLGLVADTITSALNAFGMEANKSGKVADILAQSANQSAASVLDLNYAFKYSAGPAHALGISMEELAASIGIMVDAGSTGESAGTALRASMLRLVKPPKEAAKALDKLGVTTTDSSGKMKPLAQLMEELQKGMNGYTDAQKASTMASIFGTEAVSAMLNLMNAGPDKIREMTKAFENSSGASKKAADDMLKGWAGALKMMESAIDSNSKTFVDALGPAIEAVANSITGLVNWFASLSETMRSVVAISAVSVTAFLIIATAVGMMASAIGTTLIPLGALIGWLGKSAAVAKVASVAMTALRAAFAFLTGPIGIVIMALTAIGTALVQLYQHNEAFRNGVNSAWDSIKSKVTELSSAFMNFAGPAIDAVVAGFNRLKMAITSAFSGDFSQLGEIFKIIGPSIAAAIIGGIPGIIISVSRYLPAIAEHLNANKGVILEAIMNVFNSVAEFLTTTLPKLIEVGSQIIMSLVNGLVQAAPSILEAMVGVINTIIQSITTYLPMIIEVGMQILQALITGIVQVLPTIIQTGLQLILTLIQGIMQMIPTLIPVAITIIETIINGIMSFLPQLLEMGINLLTTLITGITQALPMIVLAIIMVITTLIDAITANLPAIITAGISILTTLIDGIVSILPQLIDLAVNLITKVAETILANLPAIIDAGVKILMALIKGILSLLGQLGSAALELGGKIIDTLKEVDLFEVGANIIKGLIGGIGSMFSEVWGKMKELGSGIKERFTGMLGIHSPSRVFRDYGIYTGKGYVNGIDGMKSAIIKTSENMANWMKPEMLAVDTGPVNTGVAKAVAPSVYGSSSGRNGNTESTQSNRTLIIENVTVMDGYEVARVTQPYIDDMQTSKTQVKSYMKRGR